MILATALQSKIAYAAIAQIDEDETAMLPFEGARIPQVWYDASNLKLSEEIRK